MRGTSCEVTLRGSRTSHGKHHETTPVHNGTKMENAKINNQSRMEALILFTQKYLVGWIIAAIGGFANYVYRVSKGEKFSIMRLCLNMALAGWLWYVVWEFLPRGGLFNAYVSISGFCAFPILDMIEKKWPALILRILNRNVKDGTNE